MSLGDADGNVITSRAENILPNGTSDELKKNLQFLARSVADIHYLLNEKMPANVEDVIRSNKRLLSEKQNLLQENRRLRDENKQFRKAMMESNKALYDDNIRAHVAESKRWRQESERLRTGLEAIIDGVKHADFRESEILMLAYGALKPKENVK